MILKINYLLFEERNDLYNNKTLNDLIKLNILSNFQEQVKKYLVYFPECDSLQYFNKKNNLCIIF